MYIFVFWLIPNFYYIHYIGVQPEITQIESGLYLANMAAVTEDNINKYNISNIVELHDAYKNKNRFDNVKYLSMEFDDRWFVPIKDKFVETNAFISSAIHERNENVLLHCSAGVSRSAAICTAYLIHSGYTFEDAVKRMEEKRSSYDPNTGFRKQLKQFAQTR